MARYVDADKLLEYLEKGAESEDVKYSFIGAGVQATINEIKKFPSDDVKPVVHAHWMKINNPNYSPFDQSSEYYLFCSNCECGHVQMYDFCPSCGAKMDEEEEG